MSADIKYHINKNTGKPVLCGARKRACPNRGQHYATPQEAMKASIVAQLHTPAQQPGDEARAKIAKFRLIKRLQEDNGISDDELNQIAHTNDGDILYAVAAHPALVDAHVMGRIALHHEVDVRRSLVARYMRGEFVTPSALLLLSSDRDMRVREAVTDAREELDQSEPLFPSGWGGSRPESEMSAAERQSLAFMSKEEWLRTVTEYPDSAGRARLLQKPPFSVSLDDEETLREVYGLEGPRIHEYAKRSAAASSEEKNNFLYDVRVTYRGDEAEEYNAAMVAAATAAIANNREEQFENARLTAGDVGAVLVVKDEIPADLVDRVTGPAVRAGWLNLN